MDRDASLLLRRYVIRRSSGAYPCPEYARRIPIDGVGFAWQRCDEHAAHAADRWRRVRIRGRPWCLVLGPTLDVAQDVALQSFFATMDDAEWFRLEQQVRHHPRRCLSDWRAAGQRLIEAAQAAAAGHRAPGKLSGWPAKRGTGARSLVPDR